MLRNRARETEFLTKTRFFLPGALHFGFFMRFLVYGEYTLIRGFLTGAPNFGDEHSTHVRREDYQ